VIGDLGKGVFVEPGVPEFMRERAVPAADIITPNQFELDYLSGHASTSRAGLHAALKAVHARGPRVVLVTSYLGEDTPQAGIDLVASAPDGLWRVRTPRLDADFAGTGDTVAALFLVHYLRTRQVAEALSLAASSIYGLLKRTVEARESEILTVRAQDEFVAPREVFRAEPL
jgi:pyridoxine kinase